MKKSIRQTGRFIGYAGLITSEIKRRIISRMFWGRSSLYKNITHFLMITITVAIALGGIVYRISDVSASQKTLSGGSIIGSDDLLTQGGSVSTVAPNNSGSKAAVPTIDYVVKQGDSLADIASSHDVTIDTIRWANPDIISPFSNEVQAGWKIKIPTINGVLYQVKPGQSLDDIIAITSVNNSESNKWNIIELNQLPAPYTLTPQQTLFIPDGNLRNTDIAVDDIPRGVFINPLSHPDCSGYIWQRGFSSYHDGVDLSKWDGCPVEAVATGDVYYAGWENLSGNCIKIDHGGGIHSYYYHLEAVYVKPGQRVQQGDVIGYMGSTGNSTGTHLHFTLKKNSIAVDPAPYVPY